MHGLKNLKSEVNFFKKPKNLLNNETTIMQAFSYNKLRKRKKYIAQDDPVPVLQLLLWLV